MSMTAADVRAVSSVYGKIKLNVDGEVMKRNMDQWLQQLKEEKKPMPILSFPAIQLMGITVNELVHDSELQARAMEEVAKRHEWAASVSMMDLSVEAECFGANIKVDAHEVPTVIGSVIETEEDAQSLEIPHLYSKRIPVYIEAIKKALERITDRPVFAGVIGPFSLAGRLLEVSNALMTCYEDPDLVHTVLKKATDFIIQYAAEYKKAGANGIVLAEPLAGLLSPEFAQEFSAVYVKKIIEELDDENFLVIYHNCGDSTIRTVDSILSTKARAVHLGNSVNMAEMLEKFPEHIVVMGNVDPAGTLKDGTREEIQEEVRTLLDSCSRYPNFVISTGCDVPPVTPWEHIDLFYETIQEYYQK